MICKAEGQGIAYGSGDGTVEDCVFPFRHEGKEYNGCAKSSDGKGSYCATKVDAKGDMVKDKWARCNAYCAKDPGNHFTVTWLYVFDFEDIAIILFHIRRNTYYMQG